jgi:hypothetical protein
MPELVLALSQARCRVERAGDEHDLRIAAGGRHWQLLVTERDGWLVFRTRITHLSSRDDDELLSFVQNTLPLRPARFAADRDFGILCAEFPTSAGDGAFYAFARLYLHALEGVVSELVPDAPGIAKDPFLDPGPANSRHEVADHPDSGWQPPVPFGSRTIDDVEITIDARVEDNVAIMTLLPTPPACDRAMLERILAWQLDRRSVGIGINDQEQFFVAACWPRKLMSEDLFISLVDEVVRAVPDAEALLVPG